jgi:hypothetical protein
VANSPKLDRQIEAVTDVIRSDKVEVSVHSVTDTDKSQISNTGTERCDAPLAPEIGSADNSVSEEMVTMPDADSSAGPSLPAKDSVESAVSPSSSSSTSSYDSPVLPTQDVTKTDEPDVLLPAIDVTKTNEPDVPLVDGEEPRELEVAAVDHEKMEVSEKSDDQSVEVVKDEKSEQTISDETREQMVPAADISHVTKSAADVVFTNQAEVVPKTDTEAVALSTSESRECVELETGSVTLGETVERNVKDAVDDNAVVIEDAKLSSEMIIEQVDDCLAECKTKQADNAVDTQPAGEKNEVVQQEPAAEHLQTSEMQTEAGDGRFNESSLKHSAYTEDDSSQSNEERTVELDNETAQVEVVNRSDERSQKAVSVEGECVEVVCDTSSITDARTNVNLPEETWSEVSGMSAGDCEVATQILKSEDVEARRSTSSIKLQNADVDSRDTAASLNSHVSRSCDDVKKSEHEVDVRSTADETVAQLNAGAGEVTTDRLKSAAGVELHLCESSSDRSALQSADEQRDKNATETIEHVKSAVHENADSETTCGNLLVPDVTVSSGASVSEDVSSGDSLALTVTDTASSANKDHIYIKKDNKKDAKKGSSDCLNLIKNSHDGDSTEVAESSGAESCRKIVHGDGDNPVAVVLRRKPMPEIAVTAEENETRKQRVLIYELSTNAFTRVFIL